MKNHYNIKKSLVCLMTLCCVYQTSFAQLFSFSSKDKAKMGLMDINFSYGFMNQSNDLSTGNTPVDRKINSQFGYFHFEESMLSNWWNADENTRFLFGIRETLDLGMGYFKTKEVYQGQDPLESTHKYQFIFSYDGGIGGVFRVNEKMDIGLNYYFLSISTFNKSDDHKKYPKFRFRYSNYMAELSLKARSTLELKYLTDGDDGIASYIGLSLSHWKRGSEPSHIVTYDTNSVQISIGLQL